MSLYVHTATSLVGKMAVREGVRGVKQLRRVMRPAYPVELHANRLALAQMRRTIRWQEYWDALVPMALEPRLQQMLLKRAAMGSARGALMSGKAPAGRMDRASFYAFVHKLGALMSTRFRRAVFFDADVQVLQPALVASLLSDTLRLADVAMPLDTNREEWRAHGLSGAPPVCSCLVAFHNSVAVRSLWRGAATRLLEGRHQGMRQGDQEMIWLEWTTNLTQLRMLILPEEYYCPLASQAPVLWTTAGYPTGRYECKAVHRHGAS